MTWRGNYQYYFQLLPPDGGRSPRRRSSLTIANAPACRSPATAAGPNALRRCDGLRPRCSQCHSKELECIYTAQENETPAGALKRENHTLKQKTADIAELFSLLRSMPEDQSFAVIRHIRSCQTEPADVVRQIKRGDFKSDSHLSAITAASAYLPQLLSSLELELLTSHPNAYPSLDPLDVGTVDLNLIGIPFRFRSKLELSCRDEFNREVSDIQGSVDRFRGTSPSASSQGTAGPTSQGPKPNPTSSLCDRRLNNVNARQWTAIPVPNATVAAAISQYLMHDHPLSGFFDADLFIRDLVEPSNMFCSRLLFHALMAFACQGYSFFDATAALLVDRFYDEARKLWYAEPDRDSVTALSASLILFLASGSMGKDGDGQMFYQESVAIGSHGKENTPISDMDRYRSAAAWGLFNWHTLHSFYDRQEPTITTTPPVVSPQYQVNARYMGETMPNLCQLCTIMNDVASKYYGTGITQGVSMDMAERYFYVLMSWSDNLPALLIRDLGITQHAIVVHIWFHTIIIEIFRPFLSDPKSRPSLISAASLKQLKRLVYIYRSRFVASKCSFLYQPGLLYLVNCLLKDVENNEAHFYFLLCIGGYLDLAARFPVVGTIAKSIFQMAVEKGIILPSDASRALNEIDTKSKELGRDTTTIDGVSGLGPERNRTVPVGMTWEAAFSPGIDSVWPGEEDFLRDEDFSNFFANGGEMFGKE
ncbi:hypothetical protein BCR34DRAFT_597685 [Clohesyomyces aquaticus]|uniref:Zn(2)-C6 fungal-type domain-containing protein n=1 Tax=Clohesyomyces aquaticus TaxID=1231657 RepID=A0A1Y2A1M4_9PLEO|nr:hypothetical protein BCR34DRAFT_597685 [Clohesyomyces aquaticus]